MILAQIICFLLGLNWAWFQDPKVLSAFDKGAYVQLRPVHSLTLEIWQHKAFHTAFSTGTWQISIEHFLSVIAERDHAYQRLSGFLVAASLDLIMIYYVGFCNTFDSHLFQWLPNLAQYSPATVRMDKRFWYVLAAINEHSKHTLLNMDEYGLKSTPTI